MSDPSGIRGGPSALDALKTRIGPLAKTIFFYVAGMFWVGLVAYLIPVPIAIVERLFGRRETPIALTFLHRGIAITSFLYFRVADVRIDSKDRAKEGSAVVVCNHHSFMDIYLLLHVFPRIQFSARASLFRIPVLGWAMALFGHFPHDPWEPEAALRVAERWLAKGRYVGIFPEGTRAPGGVIGKFHDGAFRLAQLTTGRVQPVVVVGTDRVWPKGRRWIRNLGPVRMKVLPAMEVAPSLGRQALRARIEEIRASMYQEHRRIEEELLG